jgi:hypothetical protein
MLFFAGVLGVTMFVTHPIILGISLVSAISYATLVKGWRRP